jgi:hypothetical protein
MSIINRDIALLIGAGLIAGASIVIFLSRREKFQAKLNRPDINKRKPPTNFLIYNYFPTSSISIAVVDRNESKTHTLIDSIQPKRTGGLTKQQVKDHLKGGNIIKIFIITPLGNRHFADYTINLDPNSGERIKGLHVGMITTRFIGSTDGLRMSTTSGNAIGGNATLKIHNTSLLPLSLNGGSGADPASDGGISIKPLSTGIYLGYLHQGVTLGTIFSDDHRLYPDFQYLEPHSDLYYGVVSDLRQPLSGCWQLEFNDECDYGQTLWPFQEGIL